MKLVIGFLMYNESTAKYLADFLPSLEKAVNFINRSELKIFAFDNSDPENKLNYEEIKKYNSSYPDLFDYQGVGDNLGFGKAYNILINRAIFLKADYFLLLNPDIIIEPEAIKIMVDFLDNNSEISALSPKVYFWDYSKKEKTKLIDTLGLIIKPGLRFYDLGQGSKDNGQFGACKIIGPSGAAALFRLSDLEKISFTGDNGNKQYFDERFFMYKEDCDLAYRLFSANLKSAIASNAIMYHDRSSGSEKQSFFTKLANRSKKSRQIRLWSLENQNLIYRKYWKKQNFVNKLAVIFWFSASFIFSLILEQFTLKIYFKNK